MSTIPLVLPSGTIDVFDSGGDDPPIVFGHGLVMDHTEWTAVIEQLAPEFRCVVPVLPLGGHRRPMPEGADLTMRGIALLIAETIQVLDLPPVVLVANDWGGPQITAVDDPTSSPAWYSPPRRPSTTTRQGFPERSLRCRADYPVGSQSPAGPFAFPASSASP